MKTIIPHLISTSWIFVGNDDELDCGAPQKAQPENVGSAAPCSSVALRVCSKSFGLKQLQTASVQLIHEQEALPRFFFEVFLSKCFQVSFFPTSSIPYKQVQGAIQTCNRTRRLKKHLAVGIKRFSMEIPRSVRLSRYPLVMTNIAIENGPVEIVDFPIKNGGSFHSYG